MLWNTRNAKNELIRIGSAGSLSLLVNDSCLYSIETISSRTKVVQGENISFKDMASRILKSEGIQGFYKGYSAQFYSIISHGFMYFYIYKGTK